MVQTPAVVARMASRSRSRSRSAEASRPRMEMMVETQAVGVGTASQVAADDMETKVVNAVIAAMKKMGVLGPVTSP